MVAGDPEAVDLAGRYPAAAWTVPGGGITFGSMLKALAVVALLSGCSIALQNKPAADRADCSTSNAYWIADSVGVAAGVAAIVTSIVIRNEARDVHGAIGGVGAVGGVLYLASAGNGYRWSHQCRSSRERAPIANR